MKKLLLGFMLTGAIFAKAQNNLVLFSENGEKFHLYLNGVKQNLDPETNVKVIDLIHPTYKLKVVFEDKAKGIVDQTVYLMDGGENVKNKEFVSSIKLTGKGVYKIRPVSVADINQSQPNSDQTVVHYSTTEPTPNDNHEVNTNVNSGGLNTNVQVTETTTQTQTNGMNTNVGVNVGGVGISINVNDNMGGMNNSNTTVTSQTITTSSSSSSSDNYTQQNTTTKNGGTKTQVATTSGACSSPMSASAFNDAKSSISSKSFDETRLKVAKQIIDNNCLSSNQVKEIMLLFSFEETRLDLAKHAYSHTFDPNNYYKLNDAFTFETSVDDLDAYIKSHK
ncbi:MAG: DUF4476 domain-containing protein [Bacteroidia bacterium]|nr:DUF4476 domain-containing protein [Bacteroidia bacterium]